MSDCSIISDSGKASENPSSVKRIIFCTGRVYYDLIKARREKGLEGEIAISTVEQVSFLSKRHIGLLLISSRLFLDLTVPIRLGEERMCQVSKCRDLLGPRRAQEPGCLELHSPTLRNQLEQEPRREVSIAEFCSVKFSQFS